MGEVERDFCLQLMLRHFWFTISVTVLNIVLFVQLFLPPPPPTQVEYLIKIQRSRHLQRRCLCSNSLNGKCPTFTSCHRQTHTDPTVHTPTCMHTQTLTLSQWKARHNATHLTRLLSPPTRSHSLTFAHMQAESLNHDIQDRAIITRQMNTWRQSGLGRGAEQCGATEVMISGTKKQTWESRFKSQPQGRTTPQARPWRTFRNTRDSFSRSPVRCVSSCLCASVC